MTFILPAPCHEVNRLIDGLEPTVANSGKGLYDRTAWNGDDVMKLRLYLDTSVFSAYL